VTWRSNSASLPWNGLLRSPVPQERGWSTAIIGSRKAIPVPHPVIDYQEGSIRDDFDFGSVVALESSALKGAAKEIDNYRHAGFTHSGLPLRGREEFSGSPRHSHEE